MHQRFTLVLVALLTAGCELPARKSDPARLDRISGVYDKGDTKAAIVQLNAYVKDHPRDDLAWTILGHACEDEDRNVEARSAYDAALAINPKRSEAHVGLGLLYRKEDRLDESMRAYERAIEVDPRNGHAYSSMTLVALQRHQDAQALEYARKGHELNADDPVIAANLAVAYHYNGDLANRDGLTQVAARLGYKNVNSLARIYAGEISVR